MFYKLHTLNTFVTSREKWAIDKSKEGEFSKKSDSAG